MMRPSTDSIASGFRALPISTAQLSLPAVLRCGQSFRWSTYPLSLLETTGPSKPSHEYRICLRDRVVCLRQTADTLFYRSVFPQEQPGIEERETETLIWLKDYFQLDIDLVKLYDEWCERDQVFAKLRSRFEGLRMLRQDPWENLISFICSSNNNIARITKMITALCRHFSPPLLSILPPLPIPPTLPAPCLDNPNTSTDQELETYHPFPPPSRLADPAVSPILRSLGFGYRADYIQKTAAMLVNAHTAKSSGSDAEAPELWLRGLRHLPTPEARGELLRFIGVGRKVADCVLLMSLDKKEVIPVDTHVHQIAIKYYGFRGSLSSKQSLSPKLYSEIHEKLTLIWGEYAGWAQTVLFTADLKSFSAYGLTNSPSPGSVAPALLTEPLRRSTLASRNKRKRTISISPEPAVKNTDLTDREIITEAASLADRGKRTRRRATASNSKPRRSG